MALDLTPAWDAGNVVLRVDDYPTGIRPLGVQDPEIEYVIRTIDSSGIPYILGVVPYLCLEPNWRFLRSLANANLAMHGLTHRYHEFSRVLLNEKDVLNAGTIGRFNDLAGLRGGLLGALTAAKEHLVHNTGRVIDVYIPPCNVLSIRAEWAVRRAGFSAILSDSRLRRPHVLRTIRSDAYGRSDSMPVVRGVSTLHATWEADLVKVGDTESLRLFLSNLAKVN